MWTNSKTQNVLIPYSEIPFHVDMKMIYKLNVHTKIMDGEIKSCDRCKKCDRGASGEEDQQTLSGIIRKIPL